MFSAFGKQYLRLALGIGVFLLLVIAGSRSGAPAGEPESVSPTLIVSSTFIAPITPLAQNAPEPIGDFYPVLKVIDGDTLVVQKDGTAITLRLIGIDTPEVVDPRKPVQCFGKEASEKAKVVLNGQRVRLETDPTQGVLDKYNRTLAYIFLPDGTNFNKMMIAEGYAHEYTYKLPYKHQAEFKATEQQARENERGLWAPNACVSSGAVPMMNATSQPPTSAPSGVVCDHNTYNCSDFKTQAAAQAVFDACGGTDNDVHKLDSDGDGRVCESLP